MGCLTATTSASAPLMPCATNARKDVMFAKVDLVWDANETGLVLGMGILLITFPSCAACTPAW